MTITGTDLMVRADIKALTGMANLEKMTAQVTTLLDHIQSRIQESTP